MTSAPREMEQSLPRWAWIVLIVLIPWVGPLTWMLIGKERGEDGGTATRRSPRPGRVSRAEVISLCMNALSAVTGRRLGDASADFANIGAE